jgi:outer membrane protein TolC
MIKKIAFSLLFALKFFSLLNAQDSITLERLLVKAVENHPRQGSGEYLKEIGNHTGDIISSSWLPELNLNGAASYQSDVIEINPEIPGMNIDFPSSPKDQYKVYLEFNQKIYDGGTVKYQKSVNKNNTEISILQLDSEIEKVKRELISLYFGILELQQNLEVLSLNLALLNKSVEITRTAINEGTALTSDLQLLEVERLNAKQQEREIITRINILFEILEERTGIALNNDTKFIMTELEEDSDTIARIELKVFDLRINEMESRKKLEKSSRYPFIYAFGQAGYGNPGLNILSTGFDSYYLLGAGLKWNIWDWNRTRMEQENLELQKRIISDQKREFKQQIDIEILRQEQLIESAKEDMAKLEEIYSLRMEITETYQSRLHRGTIRTVDYLTVLNLEKQSALDLNKSRIRLQQNIAGLKVLKGIL